MRGTLGFAPVFPSVFGIIPAYAGNTKLPAGRHRIQRDHPRVCGEHPYRIIPIPEDMGSSPRMRGTPANVAGSDHKTGIIPAYAGNTSSMPSKVQPPRDHPRVCGEHSFTDIEDMGYTGSSPRMRGTLFTGTVTDDGSGIIPAYAGNTGSRNSNDGYTGDHPRVCGEHYGVSPFTPCALGSSPRMRGTPLMLELAQSYARIIPAYAGNTFALVPYASARRDHPRVCGEHACP